MAPTSGPALLRDRRLMTLLIAIGVIFFVALSLIGFSGALFTSTSRSPGNRFEAGVLGLQLSQTGPVVDGNAMAPGDVRSGAQTVTNTGPRARLELGVNDLDATSPLNSVLQVEVRQTQPPAAGVAYDGPLSRLDDVGLGTLAQGETRSYSITVEWPEREDGSRLEGAQTSLSFDWRLVSVP